MAPKVNKLVNQWHCRYRSFEELEFQLTSEIASAEDINDAKFSLNELVALITEIESTANEIAFFCQTKSIIV